MLIFVTTAAEDRFVIYLKTHVCQLFYTGGELRFESSIDRIETMKDFLLNFGINQVEVRQYKDSTKGVLVIKENVLMQIDDKDTIRGITVPVLTLL